MVQSSASELVGETPTKTRFVESPLFRQVRQNYYQKSTIMDTNKNIHGIQTMHIYKKKESSFHKD